MYYHKHCLIMLKIMNLREFGKDSLFWNMCYKWYIYLCHKACCIYRLCWSYCDENVYIVYFGEIYFDVTRICMLLWGWEFDSLHAPLLPRWSHIMFCSQLPFYLRGKQKSILCRTKTQKKAPLLKEKASLKSQSLFLLSH